MGVVVQKDDPPLKAQKLLSHERLVLELRVCRKQWLCKVLGKGSPPWTTYFLFHFCDMGNTFPLFFRNWQHFWSWWRGATNSESSRITKSFATPLAERLTRIKHAMIPTVKVDVLGMRIAWYCFLRVSHVYTVLSTEYITQRQGDWGMNRINDCNNLMVQRG